MFATMHQSGEYGMEIFSPSGNDPFKGCKLNNEGNIKKLYDRSIKGYMIAMEKESSSTSLHFPKNSKASLMATQPVLVLQLQLHPDKSFSIELNVTDVEQQRKRYHLSTNFSDAHVGSLHVSVPWNQPDREMWTNVAINLEDLVASFHQGPGEGKFFCLDTISIQPVCRIRKIFTLPLKYLGNDQTGLMIPPKFDFTTGVEATSWIFSHYPAGTAARALVSARTATASTEHNNTGLAGKEEAGLGLGLGVVGKKVPRRDSTGSHASTPSIIAEGKGGAGEPESAAAKRHKSSDAAPTPVTAKVSNPWSATPSPLVAAAIPTAPALPIVFSGRLKQKLSGGGAHTFPLPEPAPLPAALGPALSEEGQENSELDALQTNNTDADISMNRDTSALLDSEQGEEEQEGPTVAADERSADVSALTEGPTVVGHDATGYPHPPSPPSDHSGEASSLTRTEASTPLPHLLPPDSVLAAIGSPEGGDDVLERYLQLRQSLKARNSTSQQPLLPTEDGAGTPLPPGATARDDPLAQSRFSVLESRDSRDYGLVDAYVASYQQNQRLQHVRESLYLAAEEEARRAGVIPPSSTALGDRAVPAGIAEVEEDVEGDAAEPVAEDDVGMEKDDCREGADVCEAGVQPSASSGEPVATPTPPRPAVPERVRTFVDAAVSPMPSVPRVLTARPRLPHLSQTSLSPAPAAQVEVVVLDDLAGAVEEEGSYRTSPPSLEGPAPALNAVQDVQPVEEQTVASSPDRASTLPLAAPAATAEDHPIPNIPAPRRSTSPMLRSSTASLEIPAAASDAHFEEQDQPAATTSAQSMEKLLLSPFSEAVAYIQNTTTSTTSVSSRSSGGSNRGPVYMSANVGGPGSAANSVRSSVSRSQPESENVHPNGRPVDAESELAVYKARSSAIAEEYQQSIERLLQKLGPSPESGGRSPLHSRPTSTAGRPTSSGGVHRSGNSQTALSGSTGPAVGLALGGANNVVAGTPRTESRKQQIRSRVAGLLRQVAEAEMMYIAEFGFEAFEREVGFFDNYLPPAKR